MAAAVIAGAASVSAQTDVMYKGVGPVVAASESPSALPKKAQRFLDKHFAGIEVVSSEVEFPSKNVDVTLADGSELEFSAKGDLIEIDAPDNAVLSDKLLRSVVSREVYRDLLHRHLTGMVEGVSKDQFGYKVDLNSNLYDEARYGVDGLLIALYAED